MYTYMYPRPAVTVDIILFVKQEVPSLLLIQRKNPPFQDKWALPGGFVDMDETLEHAAIRELKEETCIENVALEQFYTFSEPDRDPRGRTISTVFVGFIEPDQADDAKGMDDAKQAKWFPVNDIPPLAFDHDKILKLALEKYFK